MISFYKLTEQAVILLWVHKLFPFANDKPIK